MIINVKDQIIGYVFVSKCTQSMYSNLIINSTKMFNQLKSQKQGIYSLKLILPVKRKAKLKKCMSYKKATISHNYGQTMLYRVIYEARFNFIVT